MDKNQELGNRNRKQELFGKGRILSPEKKEPVPSKEAVKQETVIQDALKREIELMNVDESQQQEVQVKAKRIQSLSEKEKIKNLVETAKMKGVVFAVAVAKSMNDPYILDTLHDILAREGYYKEFSTK